MMLIQVYKWDDTSVPWEWNGWHVVVKKWRFLTTDTDAYGWVSWQWYVVAW